MKSSKRVVMAILMLVAATFTFMPLAQAAGEPQASVQVAALNVRQGPGTGYAVLTVVHAGDNLAVSGQNSGRLVPDPPGRWAPGLGPRQPGATGRRCRQPA